MEIKIGAKAKILIVEDESIVAKTISKQLSKMGYEISGTASSGEAAVTLAKEVEADLVLMDIRLSGKMDGIAAAGEIKSLLRVPVIYLTAYTDDETLQRAKLTDPFGYIIKPFDPTKLHTTIEIALYKYRMEEKLRESELRFRTLATSAPVGIFQTDNDGNCIYVNPRWCEITGLTSDQALGVGWTQGLHPEDNEFTIASWNKLKSESTDFSHEYRLKTPAGKIRWVFGHASPLTDEFGTKVGFIGTITDITDRKELEEERMTGKKLESIGILAGGIAHDFNNLLSVITGNISMLKADENISQQQFNMLNHVEKASTQAADLAHKLITFSKGGWLNRRPVMTRELIEQVIKKHFHQVDVSSFIALQIPMDIHMLYGDELQLKQVFYNLLLNALFALGDRKDRFITFSACNVNMPDDNLPLEAGAYVKIAVQDNGPGIPEEHLSKVFDPYFTTKSMGAQKGLGLGLTICYSIVKKHKGFIRVVSPTRSDTRGGTRFEVYLPIYGTTGHDEKKTAQMEKVRNKNVLVLDDDAIIQDVITQMLSRLGYDSAIYDEGDSALNGYKEAMAAGVVFDVLLLDLINKKGRGGRDFLRSVRELDPEANFKVIAVSGYSDQSDLLELKKEGFHDILLKPFKWKDLKQMLDKYFQNQ